MFKDTFKLVINIKVMIFLLSVLFFLLALCLLFVLSTEDLIEVHFYPTYSR